MAEITGNRKKLIQLRTITLAIENLTFRRMISTANHVLTAKDCNEGYRNDENDDGNEGFEDIGENAEEDEFYWCITGKMSTRNLATCINNISLVIQHLRKSVERLHLLQVPTKSRKDYDFCLWLKEPK
ncbi:hypothetical protein HELRODRAFT_183692 [Helobdella robusta]|uniref:Uncharacterized protein n=1 Tax=Helobdella robusta TaxID=6412 RepID=T1FK19_HELRO|nr:hypothetical protein HELRODRAFT_183692 [Helobdella robusta]ESO10368.1 hypothetical protein HELRODRAFT_183692 [Helobdella robusta]